GRELWRQRLAGEVIPASVLADGHVYLATLDGALYCFQQDGGQLVWREDKNATSAPVVWKGQCYFSRRREVPAGQAGGTPQQTEHLAGRGIEAKADTVTVNVTRHPAPSLDYPKRQGQTTPSPRLPP